MKQIRPTKKKCLVVLLWSKTDRVGRSDFFKFYFIFLFFYLSYGLVEAKEAKQVIKTTFNVKGCYMVGLLNTLYAVVQQHECTKNVNTNSVTST